MKVSLKDPSEIPFTTPSDARCRQCNPMEFNEQPSAVLNRLGRPEETPALLALADAHQLVLPAAYYSLVVILTELAHEILPA